MEADKFKELLEELVNEFWRSFDVAQHLLMKQWQGDIQLEFALWQLFHIHEDIEVLQAV